jgi:hypothetical protein
VFLLGSFLIEAGLLEFVELTLSKGDDRIVS